MRVTGAVRGNVLLLISSMAGWLPMETAGKNFLKSNKISEYKETNFFKKSEKWPIISTISLAFENQEGMS